MPQPEKHLLTHTGLVYTPPTTEEPGPTNNYGLYKTMTVIHEETDKYRFGYAYFVKDTDELIVCVQDYVSNIIIDHNALNAHMTLSDSFLVKAIATTTVNNDKAQSCKWYWPSGANVAAGSELPDDYQYTKPPRVPVCTNPALQGTTTAPFQPCESLDALHACLSYEPAVWEPVAFLKSTDDDSTIMTLSRSFYSYRVPRYSMEASYDAPVTRQDGLDELAAAGVKHLEEQGTATAVVLVEPDKNAPYIVSVLTDA